MPAQTRALTCDLFTYFGRSSERDLIELRLTDERSPGLRTAGNDVDYARRQVGLLDDVRKPQGRQWRRFSRLEYDRVAARERRRNLPRSHEQRKIPRNDLARDTQRRRGHIRESPLQFVRPTRVVEKMCRSERNIEVA